MKLKPNITKEKEEALERAAGLLDALLDERVPETTKSKIQRWLASNMSKAEKYDALKKLFVELAPNLTPDEHEHEHYRKIAGLLGFEEEIQTLAPKRRSGLRWYAMRAAAVLIPAIIAGAVYLSVRTDATPKQYPLANVSVSAPEHGQKRIVLPDGSQVWVNSASNISYNDDFSENRFVILDGEAFFSVVADSGRPFHVRTDKFIVEVLGTEFNVCSHGENPTSEVILTSGSVKVINLHEKTIAKLTPDQRLTLDNSTLKASVDMIKGDTVSMWRVRDLRMFNTPLKESIEKIGIYYGLDVSMPGWKHTDDLINLDFDRELPLEQVLDAVYGITGNFTYRITGKEIIINQTL